MSGFSQTPAAQAAQAALTLPVASIDFETRSATDIKLGVERYSKDPTCEVITLSYRLPGCELARWNRGPHLNWDVAPAGASTILASAGQALAFEVARRPQALLDHVAAGGLVRGWNVMFEWHIWNNVCVPKYGWPELKLEQLVDTMAQAAACNLPQALGKCAEVLGLPQDKQKDKRGKYLIQRLCKPHKPTKTRPGIWVEDPELFAEMCDYCDQDVVVEETIAKKLRPLSPFEQQVWLLTQRINLRGVPLATDEIQVIGQVVELEKARLNAELAVVTGRAVLKATDRKGLLDWCNAQMQEFSAAIDFVDDEDEEAQGPEEQAVDPDDSEAVPALMANMRGKTVEEVLKRTDLPPAVRRALEIRAAVVQTSTAKFLKMLKIVAADGTAKNLFVYHGAGTGRWASRGGLNVQNFTRPILKQADIDLAFEMIQLGIREGAQVAYEALYLLFGDQVMDAMVSCLRGVIKAPEGYEFIDADYSSVENRVAAWLAGQLDKLKMFSEGLDEYKVFASRRLFKVPYEEVTGQQRQFTKPVILGGIFGLGWKGLIDYSKQYGVEMQPEEAQSAVKELREEYDKVRDLWYDCGDASVAAVRDPGQWYSAGEKLELVCHKGFLWMRLPSRRLISWFAPRIESRLAPWKKYRKVMVSSADGGWHEEEIEEDVYKDVVTVEGIDQKTRQWKRFPLIGSSIFQSATQATARDVLAHGVLLTEAADYPAVLLAHDEAMVVVKKGTGDPDEFGSLLCTRADWFADLPLAYETWTSNRFQK